MIHREKTERYYSALLGTEDVIRSDVNSPVFLYAPQRDTTLTWSGKPWHVVALDFGKGVYISYGDRAAAGIEKLKAEIVEKKVPVFDALRHAYRTKVDVLLDSVWQETVLAEGSARLLRPSDYSAWSDFNRRIVSDTETRSLPAETERRLFDWMLENDLCCGVFDANRLVACTLAPEMPYLPGEVQRIGVGTLTEYRNQGVAADAVSLCLRKLKEHGKTPLWSVRSGEASAQRLGRSLGFRYYATRLFLTLEEK